MFVGRVDELRRGGTDSASTKNMRVMRVPGLRIARKDLKLRGALEALATAIFGAFPQRSAWNTHTRKNAPPWSFKNYRSMQITASSCYISWRGGALKDNRCKMDY